MSFKIQILKFQTVEQLFEQPMIIFIKLKRIDY